MYKVVLITFTDTKAVSKQINAGTVSIKDATTAFVAAFNVLEVTGTPALLVIWDSKNTCTENFVSLNGGHEFGKRFLACSHSLSSLCLQA